MKKHWQIRQPNVETVRELSKTLPCHPITAAVMVNRNILSAKTATDFLNVSLSKIRAPFMLKDMDTAIHRIYTAITRREKILIFGDYDVDGITATVVLLEFFRYLGADVSYYIPHRITEGYGIQPRHISEHAYPGQIDLIITADCGSSSHEAVNSAHKYGIDIIITDHHNIAEKIPPALAVINPKRRDCKTGMENLAGVGVAFLLCICLRKHLREKGFWQDRPEPNLKNYCDLVALGTVADMVPLIEENRIFCKTGLALINSGYRPSLTALLEASAIHKAFATVEDIAFRLAPRLNAAGRLDHAARAVDLLTAKDVDLARKTADTLNILNLKRQALEKAILEDIQAYLKGHPDVLQQRTLVLSQSGWHAGVLGIVASRIMDMYFRPVVLIASPPEAEGGIGKGSARSVPGINLYEALAACTQHLENFGGHSLAAGLQIKDENIYEFQKAFEAVVQRVAEPEDLIPTLYIDYVLNFEEISEKLIDELESLMPFGSGNPEPLFMSKNVTVVSSRIVGNNHRQMVLSQPSRSAYSKINAIHFNVDDRNSQRKVFDQIVFRLRWNRWNGRKIAQIMVEDT